MKFISAAILLATLAILPADVHAWFGKKTSEKSWFGVPTFHAVHKLGAAPWKSGDFVAIGFCLKTKPVSENGLKLLLGRRFTPTVELKGGISRYQEYMLSDMKSRRNGAVFNKWRYGTVDIDMTTDDYDQLKAKSEKQYCSLAFFLVPRRLDPSEDYKLIVGDVSSGRFSALATKHRVVIAPTGHKFVHEWWRNPVKTFKKWWYRRGGALPVPQHDNSISPPAAEPSPVNEAKPVSDSTAPTPAADPPVVTSAAFNVDNDHHQINEQETRPSQAYPTRRQQEQFNDERLEEVMKMFGINDQGDVASQQWVNTEPTKFSTNNVPRSKPQAVDDAINADSSGAFDISPGSQSKEVEPIFPPRRLFDDIFPASKDPHWHDVHTDSAYYQPTVSDADTDETDQQHYREEGSYAIVPYKPYKPYKQEVRRQEIPSDANDANPAVDVQERSQGWFAWLASKLNASMS